MNLEELGNLGEFVGAVAVVISVLYLAFQVRQNTLQQRRGEMNAAMQTATAFRIAIAGDNIAEVLLKLSTSADELSAVEKVKANAILDQFFWYGCQSWERETLGSTSYASWSQGSKPMIVDLMSNPFCARWWQRNRYQFPEEFAKDIDMLNLQSE